jgi:hypothetical protein
MIDCVMMGALVVKAIHLGIAGKGVGCASRETREANDN